MGGFILFAATVALCMYGLYLMGDLERMRDHARRQDAGEPRPEGGWAWENRTENGGRKMPWHGEG